MQTCLLRFVLSRLDPRAAPIVTRLAQLNRWPSLRTAVIISLTIACLSLVGWVWLLIFDYHIPQNSPLRLTLLWLGMISIMALTAIPSGMSSISARLTGRDVRSQEFTLLRITHLTARDLIHGYFGAAILRRRLFLLVLAGLIPNIIGLALVGYSENGAQNYAMMRLVVLLLAVVGLWELCLVGGLTGAAVALVLRSESLASLLTTFTFFILVIIVIVLIFIALLTDDPTVILLVSAGLVLVPYGMVRLALRSRWLWIDRILAKYPKLSVEL